MPYTLLDRHTLFNDLTEEISRAQKNIVFDAYIWIDDRIGNRILQACLDAANRGVKIFIRKDLSASIFEHTPGRLPMFFDEQLLKTNSRDFFNKKYALLTPQNLNRMAYYIYGKKPRPALKEKSDLVKKIEGHRNVFLQNVPFLNHGKLILIDDIAYVGGQCISNDYEQWIDYNVKITDKVVTKNIWNQILENSGQTIPADTHFVSNDFPTKAHPQRKSIHHFLKDFIDTASEELIIEMSYLGKWYIPIIKRALKRGVKVKILVSKNSDTNHHTNMWVLSELLKLKTENFTIFFCKDTMIHTKGLATPHKITLGAANFHGACGYFFGLNEQNVHSTNPKLVKAVFDQFSQDTANAEQITKKSQLPEWSKLTASIEILFVFLTSYLTLFHKKRIENWRNEAADILRTATEANL